MAKNHMQKNSKRNILAIATGFFAALPMICLPLGLREGVTPAMAVSHAHDVIFGTSNVQSGEIVLEDWALVSNTDELVSAYVGECVTETEPDPTEVAEATTSLSFSDVPKYTVFQKYDDSDLPIELLDPQCFAPEDGKTTYYVNARQSILKETPDMDSKTIMSLDYGKDVVRTGLGDTWSRIRATDSQGNVNEGYVLTNTIQDTMVSEAMDITVWVDTDSLIVRAEPSTNAEEVAVVNDEDKLYVSAKVGFKWYKIKTTDGVEGYVYKSFTTTNPPPTPTPTPTPRPRSSGGGSGSSGGGGGTSKAPSLSGSDSDTIVSIAESMLGKPYVFGGTSSSGVDCAGLVTYCYAQIGKYVANGSNTIYHYYGTSISRSDLQPGDVICYDYGGWCGHVAIYVGGGQVIHASASKGVVKYGNLDMMSIIAYKRMV